MTSRARAKFVVCIRCVVCFLLMACDKYCVSRSVNAGRCFNFYYKQNVCLSVPFGVEFFDPNLNYNLPVDFGSQQWKKYCTTAQALMVVDGDIGGMYFSKDSVIPHHGLNYPISLAKFPDLFRYRRVVPKYLGVRVKCSRVSIGVGVPDGFGNIVVDTNVDALGQMMCNLAGGIDLDFLYWYDIDNLLNINADSSLNVDVLKYLNDNRFSRCHHSNDKPFDINVGCQLPEVLYIPDSRSVIVNSNVDLGLTMTGLMQSYYKEVVYNGFSSPGFPGGLYISPVFPYCSDVFQKYMSGIYTYGVVVFIDLEIVTKFSVSASLRDSQLFQYTPEFPMF